MKLAIIGSRNCPPIDIESHLTTQPDAIVSGGAIGVDTYAREYAITHGIKLIEFLPDYPHYGRLAPLVRNRQVVDECDALLAFWDGKSKGTLRTIKYAQKMNKPTTIVNIEVP